MTWVFVLLLLAAVLISFDIILPGAVLGLLGLVHTSLLVSTQG